MALRLRGRALPCNGASMEGNSLDSLGLPAIFALVMAAALVIAAVLGLMLRSALRRKTGTADADAAAELGSLREAKADLERKLAVEELRSSRVAGLEAALASERSALEVVRSGKTAVDVELAASRQETAGLRSMEADLRGRLDSTEEAAKAAQAGMDAVRKSKAAVDEELAGKVAALEAATSNVADLGRRLEASVTEQRDGSSRLEALRAEKSAVDEALSAKAEAFRIGEEQAKDLRSRLAEALSSLSETADRAAGLAADTAALKETLDQERKQAGEKIALLVQAREDMGLQFKSLAEEVMSRHGESFTKLNKEQIDGILTPLREKLGEFEQKVQASHVESVKERATLAEQIRGIADLGLAMGKETKELTQALRGRSQTQGAWGEMVLKTVLERSGLRADEEYSAQKSFAGEEGRVLRPDVVVTMPGGQKMVVDAKVSLVAFEALVNSPTEEERASNLQRHLGSVRNHIAALGSKEYHAAAGSGLDFVVMFVPIEGALAAALQADNDLVLFAAERNVTIATPTTLMMALRTIANVWHVERRNQNAEEIASRAGKLYEKFVGFVGDMSAIDDGINRARASYDKAMGKLKTGNGNLIRQVELLKAMGGRTTKAIPSSLLETADGHIAVAMTTHTVQTEVTVETTTDMVMVADVTSEEAVEEAAPAME